MATTKRKMTREELILQVIIFSLGFFFAFVYYVRVSEPIDLQAVSQQLFAYLTAMLTAAFAIGMINLTRVHWINIKRKRATWKFSVILIASLYGMAIVSLISSPFALDPQAAVIPQGVINLFNPIFDFLYYKVLVTINSSIFSLLAFFIASAAYRAFKARSLESTILLLAGLLVVIGQAPVADVAWPGFATIRDWILAYPNTAGQRGILIGAALGILAFSVRRMIRYPWGR
ncbi:MAG: hypothetical protein ABSF82_13915 [Candidatus Bathyarchaeia archaeon]